MVIVWPAVHCSFHCIAAHQNTIRLWLWEGDLNEAWVSWQASRLRSVTTTLAFSLANTWCVSQCQCNLTYSQEVQNRGKLYATLNQTSKEEWMTNLTDRTPDAPAPSCDECKSASQHHGWVSGGQDTKEEILHWSPKISATKKRQYPLFRIEICRKVEN